MLQQQHRKLKYAYFSKNFRIWPQPMGTYGVRQRLRPAICVRTVCPRFTPMLEQLLRRIASRGELPPLLDNHGQPPVSSPSSSGNSGRRSFPARGVHAATAHPQQDDSASSLNLWQGAVDDYLAACASRTEPPSLPSPFAQYGDGHAALAQLLWEGHKNTLQRGMHILGPHALVAMFGPLEKKVWVHRNLPTYAARDLAWQEAPEGALPPATQLGEFDTTNQHHLLWFYGQTVPEAVHALPASIGEQALRLRRFPPVDPKALELRHLAMLRLFSSGPMPFSHLLANTKKHDQCTLVPDVASFYFTGALAVVPRKG